MQAPPPEKKRKETLLSAELGKFLDKRVRVKFQGGREGESMHLHSQEEGDHFLAWESREEERAIIPVTVVITQNVIKMIYKRLVNCKLVFF